MKTDIPSKLNKKNEHRVRVGRSSAGLGLFATDFFQKGEHIVEYVGKRLTNKEVDKIVENRYLLQINEKYTIDGSTRANIARYANHSCKPNAETDTFRGRAYIIAKKTIRPGDEITWNYGKAYFDDFIKDGGCKCSECASVGVA
ncbi:hypothetical protein MNBD_CPR01-75 [hydrothermal vent metagenome]|uniref:SET domain-containing protein n=1 Tax=hydrothermal vent metagenome TaxID=652676 RepID=A0A3B0UZZ0_9ZZZZ